MEIKQEIIKVESVSPAASPERKSSFETSGSQGCEQGIASLSEPHQCQPSPKKLDQNRTKAHR